MKVPRIIPCLLLEEGALVKTQRFKKPLEVGDPLSAVRIYNERGPDELIFLDIAATIDETPPRYELLQEISRLSFSPFAYGGGLRTVEDVGRVLACGAEKVVLGTAAFHQEKLIEEAVAAFGSSRVVVSIDVGTNVLGRHPQVKVSAGQDKTGVDPVDWAREIADRGVGEILLTSIDREGLQEGYDHKLVRSVTKAVPIPVIAHGGAGSLEEMAGVIKEAGASAAAASSLFVFRSNQRAVLFNYPKRDELDALLRVENPLTTPSNPSRSPTPATVVTSPAARKARKGDGQATTPPGDPAPVP